MYAYFNNDWFGHAVTDARLLRRSWPPTSPMSGACDRRRRRRAPKRALSFDFGVVMSRSVRETSGGRRRSADERQSAGQVTHILDIENLSDQIDPSDVTREIPSDQAQAREGRPDPIGGPNPSPRSARTLLREPADVTSTRPDLIQAH